jgi:putative N6-adenine-specific DNA methylase
MSPGKVSHTRYACYAITTPGLEEVTGAELRALGHQVRSETGGIGFHADPTQLVAASIELRTATRVIVRIGQFEARAFHDLEIRAKRIPWEAYAAPGTRVRFRVTSHKSKLFHQDAIAERLLTSVQHRLGSGAGASFAVGDEDELEDHAAAADEQLFVVRLAHDTCTISADSSGALLHRRGYRVTGGKAPMRETLAAAMLLGIGWDGSQPLLDPFCGSGTIPIEAALLARRIAPNLPRGLRGDFACLRWPAFDQAAAGPALARAMDRVLLASPVPIAGSDRDSSAIAGARVNAERADVPEVAFTVAPFSAVDPPELPGWIVTNPPYGVRIGEQKRLRALYAQLGKLMRTRWSGWRLAMLESQREVRRFTGLTMREVASTRNGGIRVRLVTSGYPSAPAS